VLVVDQTSGDCSISYGNASAESFSRMMDAARAENPGAEIILKVHPEVVSGRKSGHLTHVRDDNVRVVDFDVNPWSLFDQVDVVYVVTSQLGMEALFAGKRVVCFGSPFYAGWGLTDDRVTVARRSAKPSLDQLFAALYFDYCRYLSPTSRRLVEFEEVVSCLIEERARLAKLDERGWPASA
jgi:capsular polysaccharide export protein